MDAPRARLVLVHGTRQDAGAWEPYEALLPRVELVAVDLPGHGSRLGQPFTTAAALDIIGDAVKGATPGQKVVLAGHSLGGYLSLAYAARRPAGLDALILVGASADPTNPLAWPYKVFARALPHLRTDRLADAANSVMSRLGAEPTQLAGGEAFAALPAAWQAVFDDCGPDLLDDVRCPVVLVNGQFDQMRVHAGDYAERCGARVVTIPRATHVLPLTHPDALAAVFQEVLDEAARADPTETPPDTSDGTGDGGDTGAVGSTN